MLIYEHGYNCQWIERRAWREGGKIKYYQIVLKTIKDEKEYEDNLGKLWGLDIAPDYTFIIAETKKFLKKYSNNIHYDSHLRDIASAYEELGDHQSAKNTYKEMINRGISVYSVEEAKRRLQMLEQKLNRKGRTKMSHKSLRVLFSIIVVMALMLMNVKSGYPYNTSGEGGHRGLAEKSLKLKRSLHTGEKLEEELSDQLIKKIKDATSAEDSPIWKTRNHFYNPVTEKGLSLYFDSAKERAEKFYKSAVNSYCAKDKSKAWDKLGHALHLLQDMGSPSHVRNATHIFQITYSNWGFENYVSN